MASMMEENDPRVVSCGLPVIVRERKEERKGKWRGEGRGRRKSAGEGDQWNPERKEGGLRITKKITLHKYGVVLPQMHESLSEEGNESQSPKDIE